MKQYPKYSPANLPWLEFVPSHWDMVRNKSLLKESKATVGAEFLKYPLLSLTKGGVILRDVSSGKGKFPSDFSSYKVVEQGQIIFCLFDIDETPRTIGLSKFSGMITGAYDVFSISVINPNYLKYYYLSLDDVKAMRPLYTGLRKVIGVTTFLQTKLPFPPRDEQDQIVRYLDWKVSQINKLVNAKRQQIMLLLEQKRAVISTAVLKNQERWGSKRIKYLFTLRDERNHMPASEVRLLSLYAAFGVFPTDEIEKTTGNKSTTVENYKRVYAGDIVVNIILCWQGAIGLSNYNGVTSPAYDVYVPLSNEVYANFYHYLFRTKWFGDECFKVGHGIMTMRWRVYSDEFSSIRVPVPPLSEQQSIVTYLDEQCGRIDKIIGKLNDEISLFTEYRTRLISDIVTGKMDIRGIAVPEYEIVEESAIEEPSDDETISETEE